MEEISYYGLSRKPSHTEKEDSTEASIPKLISEAPKPINETPKYDPEILGEYLIGKVIINLSTVYKDRKMELGKGGAKYTSIDSINLSIKESISTTCKKMHERIGIRSTVKIKTNFGEDNVSLEVTAIMLGVGKYTDTFHMPVQDSIKLASQFSGTGDSGNLRESKGIKICKNLAGVYTSLERKIKSVYFSIDSNDENIFKEQRINLHKTEVKPSDL